MLQRQAPGRLMCCARKSQMTELRTLSDFEGAWALHRRISPRQGVGAIFEGTAVWSRIKDGLAYVETGLIQLEGQMPMQAERRYFWSEDLCVYFEDGRFFHTVPSQGGQSDHWCDPDMYIGTYDFTRWPDFEVTWQVTGPKKDYLLQTLYTRS